MPKMIQLNMEGNRWYYANGVWYASVTSFVDKSRPTPVHLLDWYKKNSKQETDQILRDTSSYGTKFHDMAEEFMQCGILAPPKNSRLARHLASLAQFAYDYDVEPLYTEIRLRYDADENFGVNLAGTCDLLCKMNGKLSIVDYKTGNITDKHKYQIMCYAMAYAQKTGIDKNDIELYNFRPKDWRKNPTYELKRWSIDGSDWEILDAMSKLFIFEYPKPIREFEEFTLRQQPIFNNIDPEKWIEKNDSGSSVINMD